MMLNNIDVVDLDESDLSYYNNAKNILYIHPEQLDFLPLNDDYTELASDVIFYKGGEYIKFIKHNKDEIYIKLLRHEIEYFKHLVDPSFKVCLYAYYTNKKTLSCMDINNKKRIEKYPSILIKYEAFKIDDPSCITAFYVSCGTLALCIIIIIIVVIAGTT
uniref:Uncharacterized protein n=1 Tax=Pithovirus LCPAC102 TaxID=2506587 RepID=A0A481Z458_9VIRU|nr:MAG: hypothetical protein LCPAC102_02180 [Pithovirus LCPAC102]